ncbi:MAG TPA: carboxypeptidase-like regulatory domain-containing protein [Longimicrobiales bacterium]|nr:carboxypeptidase-like regulatory domain-containing protein [Longimicrobiales bacterium]
MVVLFAAQSAQAQVVTVLSGRTLDFVSEAPIATVEIELLDARQRRIASTISDSAGRFRFERHQSGSWQLRARSIGYQTVLTPPVDIAAGDTVDVVIRLGVDAVPLAPLEVVARAEPVHRHPGLAAFYRRVGRDLGGRFVLRAEIDERNQRLVTDLLTTTGVHVIGNPSGGDVGLYMKRLGCAPVVYLDGAPVGGGGRGPGDGKGAYEAANLLLPFDVEGIEVYAGPATIPPEFGGSSGACGVIAIWTRRGG